MSDDDNSQNAYLSLLSGLEDVRELLEHMSDISFYVHVQKNSHVDEYSPVQHRKYDMHLQEMIHELNAIGENYELQLREYELGEIRPIQMMK